MSCPNCCLGVVTFRVAPLCACSAPTVRTTSKKDKGRRCLVVIAALLTTFIRFSFFVFPYHLPPTTYHLSQRIRRRVRVQIAEDVLHPGEEVPHDFGAHERL